MPQDNIVDLEIGHNGNLVTGEIYIDYTNNTISGPGLNVNVLGQSVPLETTALTLNPNGDGSYSILGATVGGFGIPVADVQLNLGSQTAPSADASVTVLGQTTVATEVVTQVTCFVAGTLIRTARGDIAVDRLTIGDIAITPDGRHEPIRWLGYRTIECRNHPRPLEIMPIRIAANAFGENRPTHDLYVSPGHSICVDVLGEVLISAGALVNGSTVKQVEVDEVTYWHVELESHDVILAENLPAESYLDMGNRGFFRPADVVDLTAGPDSDPAQRTHADFCRPFHGAGPLVQAVRTQLQKRAEANGWSLTYDLDLHLIVDGGRLDPVVRGLAARFDVPANAKDVWLVSPTARPSDLIGSGDSRDLGLYISGLRIDDGFDTRDVAIDDPLLCIGFHSVEEGSRRWTTGHARLPAALWEGCQDRFYLRVELAGMPLPRWAAPAAEAAVAERPRLAIVA